MAGGKKKVPALNASSMADISFLLLIFFLVTTSMDVSQGLARRLPAPIPPDQKIEDIEINKRNLFVVKINSMKSQLQDMLAEVKNPNESKSINDAEIEKRERAELLRLINKYGIPEKALNP